VVVYSFPELVSHSRDDKKVRYRLLHQFRAKLTCLRQRFYCFDNIGDSKLKNSARVSLSVPAGDENATCVKYLALSFPMGDQAPNPAISLTSAGEINDKGDFNPEKGDSKCGVIAMPDICIGVIMSDATSSNRGGLGTSSAE
jgi:hypothetical protein